jgi:uncharacterized surface protein with fasciclin (FAS1) repeats
MRFFFTFLSVSALLASASAQATLNSTSYAAGLLATLKAANLTTLASVASANAAALVPLLISGNHTVFAPSDEAFNALSPATLNNTALVADVVLYHILNGTFTNLTSTHTIANSSLNATSLVNLPGGSDQVVVLTGSAGMATVVQSLSSINSTTMTTYQNLVIYIIPTVLTVPANTTSTATAANLTSLLGAISTEAPSLVSVVDTFPGITLFAPTNAAFSAVSTVTSTLNSSVITTILENHVVPQVLYSNDLINGLKLTTAAGEIITVINNATGIFLSEANGTVMAEVVQADIITQNGVIHVIKAVLANTVFNATAAPSVNSTGTSGSATNTADGTSGTPTSGTSSSASILTIGSGLAFLALAVGIII